ncbi:hypothetical protein [Rhizobium paknamense]|uniref:Uncharacterized protein n=1 Tax=Rhizobium paknamense TaxID=1206817 RepID=A0ABU0I769_9HYPH|nr:hypothetical protein [Rhizobium paknamense]MDQ0454069.1 hypothetical protein [Rhizobium paknamense]
MTPDRVAAEAADRLKTFQDFMTSPEALENALDLAHRLADSGLDDVDEIIDLTRQMGGKRYNPGTGSME